MSCRGKGFSERNIKRMLAFYREYPLVDFVPQAVAQSGAAPRNATSLRQLFQAQLLQAIPWGHHAELMAKVKDLPTRHWYMQAAVQHGWSRNILVMQIESAAHHRQGRTVSNFASRLPAPESDLVQQTLKDPYLFDFLTLEPGFHERELETDLVAHLENSCWSSGKALPSSGGNTISISASRTSTSTCCFITSSCVAMW